MARHTAMTLLLILSILILPTLPSCSKKEQVSTNSNIVLIVIDTLRSDHLPFYGYPQDTAPFLGELAANGIVFENTYSTSSWTSPATASLFTSLYPIQHGVLTGLLAARETMKIDSEITINKIPAAVETLPEILKKAGYRTFGISDNINISVEEGFDQGFDKLTTYDYIGAERLSEAAKECKEEITTNGKYFLYLHYVDPHMPYFPMKPWIDQRKTSKPTDEQSYDSEINYVDDNIRKLFQLFGWDKNTLLIVMADHGEEFMDHGGTAHGKTLYREVLQIPLLVFMGDQGYEARRVKERISIMDIVPTLREYVGLPPSKEDMGVSLMSILRGEEWAFKDRMLNAHIRRQVLKGGRTKKSLILGDWKYIITLDESEELYNIVKDPTEKVNCIGHEKPTADKMKQLIITYEAQCKKYPQESSKTSLDKETLDKLRAMGYIK
jgi:choline-sulfatase